MSECSKAQNLFSERIFAELLSDFHAFFFFFGGWGLPRPQRQCLPFFMKVSDFFLLPIFVVCLFSASGGKTAVTVADCLRPRGKYLPDSL